MLKKNLIDWLLKYCSCLWGSVIFTLPLSLHYTAYDMLRCVVITKRDTTNGQQ